MEVRLDVSRWTVPSVVLKTTGFKESEMRSRVVEKFTGGSSVNLSTTRDLISNFLKDPHGFHPSLECDTSVVVPDEPKTGCVTPFIHLSL